MIRSILVLLLLLPAFAFARTWQVDLKASTLTFSASYEGDSFEGKFARFDATIVYDSENLDASHFDVSIPLASVDTGNGDRDNTLGGSDFFSISTFPKAHFSTESFSRDADGTVTAKGRLTVRDRTQPVTLTVDFQQDGNTATLEVDTTLERLDFDLGTSDDWDAVGKRVPVHAHLVLHGT